MHCIISFQPQWEVVDVVAVDQEGVVEAAHEEEVVAALVVVVASVVVVQEGDDKNVNVSNLASTLTFCIYFYLELLNVLSYSIVYFHG